MDDKTKKPEAPELSEEQADKVAGGNDWEDIDEYKGAINTPKPTPAPSQDPVPSPSGAKLPTAVGYQPLVSADPLVIFPDK